jgi:glycosyltransferase involved in cell wall biosynthesis
MRLVSGARDANFGVFDVTIAIVTRNRRDELRQALRSAVAQKGRVEVLVIDDGSSDATAEMVAEEFPDVRCKRFEESAGLVVRRNDAARLARAPIVVSIDDDAAFTSSAVVAQTLKDFDDPRIGAVAVPYVDVRRDAQQEHQRAPDRFARWTTPSFRGTAYAVRRDVFLKLNGFRELIVHQGEERDYALRMLAAGYLVRLGRADAIHHFESPKRDITRMSHYGRRNEQLLASTNFPFPMNAALMLLYALKGLRLGLRLGLTREMMRGIAAGVRSSWRLRSERQPLSWRITLLYLILCRHGALPLDDVASRLPAIRQPRVDAGEWLPAGVPQGEPMSRVRLAIR